MRSARKALSPLHYSSGLQNKVIETVRAGLPTIVTPTVADALAPIAEGALVVVRSDDELVQGILRLFEDPDLAQRIGRRGREWFEGRYAWREARDRFRALLGRDSGPGARAA
jgi:glycosyltransferase involved in cell wall biosynthesis